MCILIPGCLVGMMSHPPVLFRTWSSDGGVGVLSRLPSYGGGGCPMHSSVSVSLHFNN